MTGVSFCQTSISPVDIDVWVLGNPGVSAERADSANAIDGDTGTISYTTPAFTTTGVTIALDISSTGPISGLRLAKNADCDAYGGSGYDDGTTDLRPKEAVDLTIYYTTDAGALNARTWTPVSGLTRGYNGSELMVTLGLVDSAMATVDREYHDFAGDGWASLSFEPVAGCTGLAIDMVYDENHTGAPYRHYGVYEWEVCEGGGVDSDNDGLLDSWEHVLINADPGDAVTGLEHVKGPNQAPDTTDFDGDGLTDAGEYTAGTDATKADSDDDGIEDGDETTGAQNPYKDGHVPGDPPGGTPGAATDPKDGDSDDDGLLDGRETAGQDRSGASHGFGPTDPNAADTDGDTHDDLAETDFGSDPTDPTSFAGILDGLVGYWQFENNWDDSSANANHMTSHDVSPALVTGGKVGTHACEGDGTFGMWRATGSSIDPSVTGSNPRTMNLWFKANQDLRFTPVGYGFNAGGAWQLLLLPSTHGFGQVYGLDAHIPDTFGDSNPGWTAGTWYMVTITYDPDVNGGTAKVYQDGTLVDSADNLGLDTNASALYVGTGPATAGFGSAYFDGMIDDLAVWNRVLPAGQIATIHDFGELGLDLFEIRSGAATATLLASSPNPSTSGDHVTFTAVVQADGVTADDATGTMTFFLDGATTLGDAGVTNGVASLGTTALADGLRRITARYSGDATYVPSVGGLTQVVLLPGQEATTTVLESSGNPSLGGGTIGFTATVQASGSTAGEAGGMVTFKDGGVTLGTSMLSHGKAVFRTGALAVGTHSVTAEYGGDGSYGPSVSAALPQVVEPPTRLADPVRPFGITDVRRTADGSVTLTWDSSLPGAVYTVESSTNLVDWTPLPGNVPPSGDLTSLLLPAGGDPDPATEPKLFLRVREVPAVEVILVDPEPYGSTFQSHNQKVVANDHGIFVTYYAGGSWPAGYYRLARSVDGGRNFTTIYQYANAVNIAPMETDEHDNIYLAYGATDGAGLNFLRFSPANGFAEPVFVRTHAVPLGAKIAMAYDRARQQFYVASQWGAVFTLDKSGNLLRNQSVFGSVNGHVAAYPHLMVDSSGVLHFADTTALAGDCIPYVTIRYLRSADGGATWTKMDGTALSLPTSPAPDGPSDMINLPDEVSPYSSWLANFHVKDGKAHFIYAATNPWDPECLGLTTPLVERQHYMRFNAGTGVREIDSWAETGGWCGGGTCIYPNSGLLASDVNDPAGPLYGVAGDSMSQLTSLVSLDNGSTWKFHASSAPRSFYGYAVGGCRTLAPGGNIIGTFSAGDANGDWHVYFFAMRGYPGPWSP